MGPPLRRSCATATLDFDLEIVFSASPTCVPRTVGTLAMVHANRRTHALGTVATSLGGLGWGPELITESAREFAISLQITQLLTSHSRLSTPVQNRQAGRWQCTHREALERLEWGPIRLPSRIIFSFNTPFCTSAPSKSGCSGNRSQPSLACFHQKQTYLSCTCKINHPATGGDSTGDWRDWRDWKLRRNTQQRGFVVVLDSSQECCPSPILDRGKQANRDNHLF
jgi:hypothetical protein